MGLPPPTDPRRRLDSQGSGFQNFDFPQLHCGVIELSYQFSQDLIPDQSEG